MCRELPEVIYARNISWPSLCLNCHRRKESTIILYYDQEILRLQIRIEELWWDRRAEPDVAVQAEMRAEITSLEEQLGDARDDKSEQLDELRTLQGCRSDG